MQSKLGLFFVLGCSVRPVLNVASYGGEKKKKQMP